VSERKNVEIQSAAVTRRHATARTVAVLRRRRRARRTGALYY
jgi:hypothetical protein